MIQIKENKNCMGCGACAQICPKGCIEMKADTEGFLYPAVEKGSCIDCKRCEQVCPVLNTSFVPKEDFPDAYLIYDTDSEWRKKSAAGGGFAAIARDFMNRYGGVVFGAVYDDRYFVYHKKTDTIDGIKAIQKSKYVQSETRDTFREVKEELKNGKYVLYSGTPCQIYGLKSYLGKLSEDEKLFCVDLSCHGVPSPKVFQLYLDYLRRSEKSRIATFTMRDKQYGKNNYKQGFGISFENGNRQFNSHPADYFGRCFWGEISSRPSCYDCHFKTVWRSADITLGDCWFFNSFVPTEQDTMGVTLAFTHSEKGKALLNDNEFLRRYSVPSEKLIKVNGGMIYSSAEVHPKRDEFFKRLKTEPFENVVDSMLPKKPKSKKNQLLDTLERFGIRLEKLRKKSREHRINALLQETIPDNALGEMK